MRLAALVSKRNLELAWRRVVTARNLQHKRFFRHLYGGYELGLKSNLDLLHARLQGNWRATPPTRIYIPKPSGLLRPITLLAIEDQIVLQAVANKVALQVRARRRKVEMKQVFSNCLERRDDSIFFLRDWRKTYQAFQRQLEAHLNAGYRWIAHFDLAAFYETISHRALRSVIAARGGSPQTWMRINQWLCVWSAARTGVQVDHGIPQGPIASDFLADVFMLPVDEAILTFAAAAVHAGVYSRYSMTHRLRTSDPYVQSLVIPFLDSVEFRREGIVGNLLRQPHAEPGLAVVTKLVEQNLTHRSFGLRPTQLAPQVKNALQAVGLLPPGPAERFDQIGDILRDRFGIDYWRKWRNLFGAEYAHALSMLLSGDAKYALDPSEWLSWQDSFNDALFRAMQAHMGRLHMPGACSLTNRFGELIDYGVLLDPNQVFATAHPNIATAFRAAHTRRNSLPTNHPYEKKTARQTRYLKPRERENITQDLRSAYREVIFLLDVHL